MAGYAAKQAVEAGLKPGELTIVSRDSAIPYERPPLSKSFLAGKDTEESIRINPAEFYGEHGIDVLLNTEVVGVDAGRRRLRFRSGEELGFDKLVISTGSAVRTLDIPGSRLPHVYYLRSLADAKSIRAQAAEAKLAVVVGGGFIGMEVAAVLAGRGVDTLMVVREDRIWPRFFTPEMSRFFAVYYAARDVEIVTGETVRELRGGDAVETVVLGGGREVPCDMLVAGIGVRPVTEPLSASGIEVENGVLVNEYLETSRPEIWAAGDVANYQDALFGKRRRVEHWDNAVSQGQHVARAMLGERKPFMHVPYFFSDEFDLSYEFWGDSAEADQIVHRGDVSTRSFSVWWLRGERLVGAFTMNRPEEEREAAPRWIESRQRVSAERLRDESRPLAAVLTSGG